MKIYSNPKIYTPTKKPKKTNSGSKLGYLLIVLILITAGFYFFMFSPYFQIRNIIISGVSTVLEDEIREEFAQYQKQQSNLFLFPDKKVEVELLIKYPVFSEVLITKGVPDSLKVEIIKRKGIVALKSQEDYYLIDESGIVFQKTENSIDLPIIEKNQSVNLGDRVFSKELISFVLELVENFSSKTHLKIERIEILETIFELNVWVTDGFKIIFDTTRSCQDQLVVLQKVIPEISGKKIHYLDLRLGEKVFYQ